MLHVYPPLLSYHSVKLHSQNFSISFTRQEAHSLLSQVIRFVNKPHHHGQVLFPGYVHYVVSDN